jgi:hypothetical protein
MAIRKEYGYAPWCSHGGGDRIFGSVPAVLKRNNPNDVSDGEIRAGILSAGAGGCLFVCSTLAATSQDSRNDNGTNQNPFS